MQNPLTLFRIGEHVRRRAPVGAPPGTLFPDPSARPPQIQVFVSHGRQVAFQMAEVSVSRHFPGVDLGSKSRSSGGYRLATCADLT